MSRDEDQQQSDGLRWLVVGGTLAVLLLVIGAVADRGSDRSFVEIVVAVPLAVAVVAAGRHLRRGR